MESIIHKKMNNNLQSDLIEERINIIRPIIDGLKEDYVKYPNNYNDLVDLLFNTEKDNSLLTYFIQLSKPLSGDILLRFRDLRKFNVPTISISSLKSLSVDYYQTVHGLYFVFFSLLLMIAVKNGDDMTDTKILVFKVLKIIIDDIENNYKGKNNTIKLLKEENESRKEKIKNSQLKLNEILSTRTDVENYQEMVDKFNSFKDDFSIYVGESLKKNFDISDGIKKAYGEETEFIKQTMEIEKVLDGEKQIIQHTQKKDALEQNVLAFKIKYNQHISDLQTNIINQLKDSFITLSQDLSSKLLKQLELNETPNNDSHIWTKEVYHLESFLKEKINLFVSNLTNQFIISPEFLTEMASLYKDIRELLNKNLVLLHEKLNSMITTLTIPDIRSKPLSISDTTCYPFYYELETPDMLRCWDRGTERKEIKNAFRKIAKDKITILCCKKHKKELERVREIKMVGYLMNRINHERDIWIITVKNGF
jgi:hypothetical protein